MPDIRERAYTLTVPAVASVLLAIVVWVQDKWVRGLSGHWFVSGWRIFFVPMAAMFLALVVGSAVAEASGGPTLSGGFLNCSGGIQYP